MEARKIITSDVRFEEEMTPIVDAIIDGSIFGYVMNLSFRKFAYIDVMVMKVDCSSLKCDDFDYDIDYDQYFRYKEHVYITFGPLTVYCNHGPHFFKKYKFIMNDKTINYSGHFGDCGTSCICNKTIGEQFSFKATKNARK